jgi:hypothetical protein
LRETKHGAAAGVPRRHSYLRLPAPSGAGRPGLRFPGRGAAGSGSAARGKEFSICLRGTQCSFPPIPAAGSAFRLLSACDILTMLGFRGNLCEWIASNRGAGARGPEWKLACVRQPSEFSLPRARCARRA